MVIKGNARAGAKSLAAHVLRADTNERVEVEEIRGVIAEDVEGALREMEAVACCTNTRKPLYHASINTRADERLTPEQRLPAIDRLEEALSLTGQPRVVVIHEKAGREHCHIIWSRTDLEKGIAIRMDHNFRTHEFVARELEREFGHERVQGAHVERDGKPRPARTPGHDEMQQAVPHRLEAEGGQGTDHRSLAIDRQRASLSGGNRGKGMDSRAWRSAGFCRRRSGRRNP